MRFEYEGVKLTHVADYAFDVRSGLDSCVLAVYLHEQGGSKERERRGKPPPSFAVCERKSSGIPYAGYIFE